MPTVVDKSTLNHRHGRNSSSSSSSHGGHKLFGRKLKIRSLLFGSAKPKNSKNEHEVSFECIFLSFVKWYLLMCQFRTQGLMDNVCSF
jgi:hypothetical protein